MFSLSLVLDKGERKIERLIITVLSSYNEQLRSNVNGGEKLKPFATNLITTIVRSIEKSEKDWTNTRKVSRVLSRHRETRS